MADPRPPAGAGAGRAVAKWRFVPDERGSSGMGIRVYNTLTRTKEDFDPVRPGKVGIYLCGPTVYDKAHIGHMVGPVIFDTIKRYLAHAGYDVTLVVNITDVDDKLIVKARERGVPMAQVAAENTADYLMNLKALGVDRIDQMPTATGSMNEIIGFIESLIDNSPEYNIGVRMGAFLNQADGFMHFIERQIMA